MNLPTILHDSELARLIRFARERNYQIVELQIPRDIDFEEAVGKLPSGFDLRLGGVTVRRADQFAVITL